MAAKIDLDLTQRRYVDTASGVTKYKIEASVVTGTDSSKWTRTPPITTQIFVMTIGAADADDTFARVSNIADLDLVETQRYVAVANSKTEYRASTVTLSFDGLDTSVAAIPVIKDRVNSLVSVWNKAQTDFINAGDKTSLPVASTEATVEEAATSDYTTTRDARKDADTEQATAQTEFEDAQKDTAAKLVIKDIHCDYDSRLKALQAKVGIAASALTASALGLEGAAGTIAKTTRADSSGTVDAPGGDLFEVKQTGGFTAKTYAGDLVAVTFSNAPAAGKTEVRAIDSHTDDTITVHQAFSQIPTNAGTPDTWEVRLLNDFLPGADFGATSKAADAARAASADIGGVDGVVTKVGLDVAFSTTECGTATTNHTTATTTEAADLSTLTDKKALKDAAQTKENTALAALQEVCPDKDITTL